MNTLAGNPRLKGGRKKKGAPTIECQMCLGEGYLHNYPGLNSFILMKCCFCKGTGKIPVSTQPQDK